MVTKFHNNSITFIPVLFVVHAGTGHGFWTSSSHGMCMAFAKKMTGFPLDLVSFSNQTAVKKTKRHENTRVTFFTGLVSILELPQTHLIPINYH